MNGGLQDSAALGIYLFTFCPPGPDDLLYEISHRRLGIIAKLNVESHSRANSSSFSEGSSTLSGLIPLLDSSLSRRLLTTETLEHWVASPYRLRNIAFCKACSHDTALKFPTLAERCLGITFLRLPTALNFSALVHDFITSSSGFDDHYEVNSPQLHPSPCAFP